jgi:hypothetical protein
MPWRPSTRQAQLYIPLGIASLSLAMCAHDGQAPGTQPSRSPSVATISPASGSVGAAVVVTGAGFSPTGNTVRFGPGYINGLNSSDGSTLRFTIPEGQNLCPPGGGPCAAAYPRVTPGPYSVSVMNANGESNAMTFTVSAH